MRCCSPNSLPTDDGDVIDKCPAISCSVTVSFADGFTGLDFDIASYDNRSSGIWPTLEILVTTAALAIQSR